MPAMSSFTVNDRATTPVAHTFAPRGKEPAPLWGETAVIPDGEKQVTFRGRSTGSGASKRFRSLTRFTSPTVVNETINGVSVPRVVRVQGLSVETTFTGDSTLQERKDCMTLLRNMFVEGGQFDLAITNPEGVW